MQLKHPLLPPSEFVFEPNERRSQYPPNELSPVKPVGAREC